MWWNCSADICSQWDMGSESFVCNDSNIVSIDLSSLGLIGSLSFELNDSTNTSHSGEYWPENLRFLNLSHNEIFGNFNFASFNTTATTNSIESIDLSYNNISTISNVDRYHSSSLTRIILGVFYLLVMLRGKKHLQKRFANVFFWLQQFFSSCNVL